jgi:hypothetical protein
MRDLPADGDARSGDTAGFPWLVTLISLLLGLGIYLHSTRPALAEAERLRDAEKRLRRSIDQHHRNSRRDWQAGREVLDNPERLLVELDEYGMTAADADRAAERATLQSDGSSSDDGDAESRR